MDIKIIVAIHKPYWVPESEVYFPLHVGKEGKQGIGFPGDDSGDNISCRNANFCELTGLYWAWKNLQADYMGLVHYRRYFTRREVRNISARKAQVLSKQDWEKLLAGTPAVVADKRRYYIETNRSKFYHAHPREGLDITEQILREKYPEYMDAFTLVMERTWAHMFNMLGFKPGLVGGHCIGVDPYYLTNAAEKLGYHSQIILNGRQVNDSMGGFVADAAIKEMIEAGMAPKKATVVILGLTFKENCPDTRNSKVVDIIKRLKEYEITPVVADPWADLEVAKHEYGVELIPLAELPKADCIIVAVGHNEFRSMSMMRIKEMFKPELRDEEKVLIDVKSLYRIDELKASGLRFWRL